MRPSLNAASRVIRLLFFGCVLQTVLFGQIPSSITLSTSLNPANYGQSVTLNATITPGATGKVTFYDGPTALGIAVVSGSQAAFTTTLLGSGARSLMAHYSGDATYGPSSSAPISQTVVAGASLGFRHGVYYGTGEYPQSITVGDFNRDGKQDLAVTGQSPDGVAVLLGNGDGTFQPAVVYQAGTGPKSVAVGDFDGDGKPDLAVANQYGATVSVLLGNGDGTFKAPVNFAVGTSPVSVVVGDFNNDGVMDLVMANSSGANVSVLIGKRDGTFQTFAMYSAPVYPESVAIADMNRDGKMDLVVAGISGLSVLLGKGDGTFQSPITYLPVSSPFFVVVTDFNGDGFPDVAVSTSSAGNIAVLLGKGDGTLLPGVTYQLGGTATGIVAGDFNGDGKLDLAIGSHSYSTGLLQVLLGNGDGTFPSLVNYSAALLPSAMAVGDFNRDGIVDLIVGGAPTSGTGATGISVTLGGAIPDLTITQTNGNGFTQGQVGAAYTITVSNVGDAPTSGAVGVGESLPAGFGAISASGNGWTCPTPVVCTRFDSLAAGASYPAITITLAISGGVTGNVTGTATVSGGNDQNPANNTAIDTAFVRFATSTTLSASPSFAVLGRQVAITATVTPGATGKVTFYDGTAVLGVAALAGGQATLSTVFLLSGSRSLHAQYDGDSNYGPSRSAIWTEIITPVPSNAVQPVATYKVGSAFQSVAAGDFNRDGKLDLVVGCSGVATNGICIMLNKGDGTFNSPVYYVAAGAAYPASPVLGDFNGDGNLDVAFSDGMAIYVMQGNGDGTFQAAIKSGPPNNSYTYTSLSSADFNGDGKADLIALSGGSPLLFLGNGDGTFPTAVAIASGGSFFSFLGVADMNGDGKADLVCGNSSSNVSLLLGNGDGSFQSPAVFPGPANATPTAFALGDFNGDGKPDVAIVYWVGISVLIGNGDGTLRAPLASNLNVTPGYSAVAGDFNGDGKLDLAISSYYSSQFYIAFGNGDGTFQPGVTVITDSNPSIPALGDFNGDGKPDLAVVTSGSTLDVFMGAQAAGLTISASHTSNFTLGKTGTFQVIIGNAQFISQSGAVTVTDTLPAGLTATSISGPGWSCTLATLVCTRSDGLAIGATYPPIAITVDVAAYLTPSTVNNRASVFAVGIQNTSTDPTNLVQPTTTTLVVSPNPAILGHAVNLTATVSPGGTGAVVFFDGNIVLGSAFLTAGQATLTTRLLEAGTRSLLATYAGDSTHAASSSPEKSQTVNALLSSGLAAGVAYSTGTGPLAVAAGDFNGDGKADLVTANNPANTVSVLLGNGDGTFRARLDYAVGTVPEAVVVADFNNDGKADLAVINSGSNDVSILLGNGDGTFQPAVSHAIGRPPVGLSTGDFNNDGKTDLVIACSDSSFSFLFGNGDGTFYAGSSTLSNLAGASFAVGDFNGDGKTDLASESYTIWTSLGNGDGTFQSSLASPGGSYLAAAVTADLNGDGRADLIGADQTNGIDISLGKGDGTFQSSVHYSSGISSAAVAVADVNGDGKLDVVAVSGNSNTMSVFLGNGDGTLQSPIPYAVPTGSHTVIAGDFNGDGLTDVVVTNSGTSTLSILLGFTTPALSAASFHSQGFALGQIGAVYTLTVTNNGPGTTSGTVTLTDTLPSALTATAISGAGWSCVLATLTCTRSDSLAAGATYPAVTLTLNVSPSAPASVTNLVSVSGGNAIGINGSDMTVIGARLAIAKTHSGNFMQGQTGAAYSLIVSNAPGAGPTNGTVTVAETLPAAMTLASMSGIGWTCPAGSTACTRTDALGAGSSYPPITVTVNVSLSAPIQLINQAAVSGGGSAAAAAGDPTSINPLPVALQFVPITPCRIMDTRNPNGPLGGPFLPASATRTIPVQSSACGVPANAVAYSLNFTVVPRTNTLGYLTVWPTGQFQPVVSTLNSPDGSVLANAAIVPAGTAGDINAFATNDTELIVDINGYFTPPGTGTLQFYPVTPCRVLDTRNANGIFGGPALGASSRSFPIPSGGCGVPASAAAYSFNVTVVPRGQLGYVTAWPSGLPQPVVSTLNSLDGTVLANAAIVPAGSGGAVSFFADHATDLVVDINGYFAPPGTGGLNFYTVIPCRIADTRNPNGLFGGPILTGASTRTFPLSQGSCGLPSNTAAYSLNMTVVPTGFLGYLTTWAAGASQPVVSTLNAYKGQVAANATIVPAGIGGTVGVYVTNTTNIVIDTNGYFAQ